MYQHGYLKVAAATPKIIVGDVFHNETEIIDLLNHTKASIVVYPELTITGYSASDLFYQESFLEEAKLALKHIVEKTIYEGVYILGMPLDVYGVLYNVAIIAQKGKILGVVPKHYIPNGHEFYEKRWFHSGIDIDISQINLFGKNVPFGYILFENKKSQIRFGVEICQDIWATYSPSDELSLYGANIIFNPSASSEFVGKQASRRHVVLDHSRKQIAAYVYTTTGHFESSSEVVFSNHKLIASMGEMVAEAMPFNTEETMLVADLDITAINYQKRQDSTYRDMHMKLTHTYQIVDFDTLDTTAYVFEKPLNVFPFINKNHEEEDLKVANHLQIFGLVKKLESLPASANKIIIGISGGLDSALALIVSHQAMKILNRDPKDIIAVTMPAQATSKNSKSYALDLMEKLGVTLLEIPIKDDVEKHLKSIHHEEKDVTYENAQARMRTLVLMDLANKYGGFVLGTGDLSEIALGWMTYNGDQMSMYAVNAGLPKTWVQHLIKFHAENEYQFVKETLIHILNAPITPELLDDQETELSIGKYEINDFILFHLLQQGADEEKIKWLLPYAFDLSKEEIEKYVNRFYRRFYTQQFKRQTLPEGPKILGISLSPRGEYRMPSDVQKVIK
ncbi:MAG: NAD(+) synthase [Acholeplasmataceae bacterium]